MTWQKLKKRKNGIHNTKIWQMLYNFQQDAAVRSYQKIRSYIMVVLLADSVGLGKTLKHLAVMKVL